MRLFNSHDNINNRSMSMSTLHVRILHFKSKKGQYCSTVLLINRDRRVIYANVQNVLKLRTIS
ncbi:hypothetical protein T03_5768 [Trichinella britovi]|uniref:Uncharacterized protein n=1 Tax=Trichinella britovi TaxID=45882 RepID=A0A0V1CNV1_TRIBR|nr:hypothetical protein T03_5768 [Trichinella britovi]